MSRDQLSRGPDACFEKRQYARGACGGRSCLPRRLSRHVSRYLSRHGRTLHLRRVRTLYLRLEAAGIPRKRKRPPRRIVRHTAAAPSGDALDHERKASSHRSTAPSMRWNASSCALDAGVLRAHYAFARLHYCRLRPAAICRSGDALAAFRAATEGRITPADYHQLVLLAVNTTHKGACPQYGGLEHVDETGLKHGLCTSGTQKRLYLHRNQNETSARRLMRNFPATVRYYPYTIKPRGAQGAATDTFVSHHWRKHELHAESSRRAQGPLSRAA